MKALLRASWPVVVEGILHGALCLWLFADGHAPSFGTPLLPQDRHYLVQGLLLPVLMPLLWLVAVGVGRLGTRPPLVPFARRMAWAMALPTAVLLVLVDACAYGWGGMEALRVAVRVSGPALLLALVVSAGAAARAHGTRCVIASWAGLACALGVGGLVLR